MGRSGVPLTGTSWAEAEQGYRTGTNTAYRRFPGALGAFRAAMTRGRFRRCCRRGVLPPDSPD
jgi:hypothetical protein